VDGKQLVEMASEEARRRRHAEVEPIHLLHALVTLPAASSVLGELGLEQPALRVACEAHLAWLPEVGSYRDGRTHPPISAALEDLVSEKSSIVARILSRSPSGLSSLVERLAADPGIAAIVLSDRSAAKSIATIVTRGAALATTRGDRIVRPEHALAVVTREPFFREALEKLGADGIRIDEAVVHWLDELDKGSGRPPTRLSKELGGVVDYAAFVAKNAEPVLAPPVAFVVRLLSEPNVMALLGTGGIDATDVAYVLVHGEVALDQAAEAPDDATLEIVFHDDEFTAQDFMMLALGEILRLPEMVARKRVLDVRANGGGVVATLPAREARARRTEIVAAARKVGMPLRVSLRPV
jgi:ATP-dependent Clp protease adapter protein ClpS